MEAKQEPVNPTKQQEVKHTNEHETLSDGFERFMADDPLTENKANQQSEA